MQIVVRATRAGAEVFPSLNYADEHNQRTLSCVTDSQIADCALALWNAEKKSFRGATPLYRVPTRKELREHVLLGRSRRDQALPGAGS